MEKKSPQLSRKVLLSLAAIGAAAAIAGLGTYATFTSATSSSNDISSGTVSVALGAAGSDNRLAISATGLIPGDTIQRRVKLTNGSGNENLASITLTTVDTTATPTLLTTDTTNGLQMKIEKCAGALGWRETGSSPYTYTCDSAVAADDAGARTSVLAPRAIIGSALALSSMSVITAGSTDDMVVTVSLPTTANNSFQGLSATVQYTFTGTQRTATNK